MLFLNYHPFVAYNGKHLSNIMLAALCNQTPLGEIPTHYAIHPQSLPDGIVTVSIIFKNDNKVSEFYYSDSITGDLTQSHDMATFFKTWYAKQASTNRDIFVIQEDAHLAFNSLVKFQSLDASVKKSILGPSFCESTNYCIAMIGQCFNSEPIVFAFKSPMPTSMIPNILSHSALFNSSNISKLVTKIPDNVTPLEEKEETNTPKKFDLMLD